MRKRVLLVEDEASLRSAFADILVWEGYEVEALPDGAAALERIARDPRPDVIVLDLLMPVLSGSEFLLAAQPMIQSIPVIVISGASAELPAGVGVCVRLQKPIPPGEFLRAVEYCLRLSRRAGGRREPLRPRSGNSSPAKQAG